MNKNIIISLIVIAFGLNGCGNKDTNLQPQFSQSINNEQVNSFSNSKNTKNSLMSEDSEMELIKNAFESPRVFDSFLGIAGAAADLKPNSQKAFFCLATGKCVGNMDRLKPEERQKIITQIIKSVISEDSEMELIKNAFESPRVFDSFLGIARAAADLKPNSQKAFFCLATGKCVGNMDRLKPEERQKIIAELTKNSISAKKIIK